MLPASPCGPSCWLSFTCAKIWLVPGCWPSRSTVLGLPVGGRSAVDQETIANRIRFWITGLGSPGDGSAQELRANNIRSKAGKCRCIVGRKNYLEVRAAGAVSIRIMFSIPDHGIDDMPSYLFLVEVQIQTGLFDQSCITVPSKVNWNCNGSFSTSDAAVVQVIEVPATCGLSLSAVRLLITGALSGGRTISKFALLALSPHPDYVFHPGPWHR